MVVWIPCDPFQSSPEVPDALNARFRAGRPSDDPATAGVVLHALNLQLGRDPSTPWLSSEKGGRVSCVVANARLPFMYYGATHRQGPSYQTPGFVLRSSVVKRAFLCAYPGDGDSNGKKCPSNWRATASPNKCTPGCPSETNPWRRGSVVGLNLSQAMFLHEECAAHLAASMPSNESIAGSIPPARKSGARCGHLRQAELASAPPPPAASLERARLVLQQQHNQYNELVLAADTLNSLLPGTIEAVYMLPHTYVTDAMLARDNLEKERVNQTVFSPNPAENDARRARSVHAQLLRRFNLTAQQLPLLQLNILDRAAPFRLAPCLTGRGAECQSLQSSLPLPPSAEAQDGLSSPSPPPLSPSPPSPSPSPPPPSPPSSPSSPPPSPSPPPPSPSPPPPSPSPPPPSLSPSTEAAGIGNELNTDWNHEPASAGVVLNGTNSSALVSPA